MVPWLFVVAAVSLCGTSPANDEHLRTIHEQTRARVASLAEDPSRAATLREGAFYLPTDQTITPGYRPFDLGGRSLVFTPEGNDAFTLKRTALEYAEPHGEAVRDFQSVTGTPNWHYVTHDLPFAVPLFGKSVSRTPSRSISRSSRTSSGTPAHTRRAATRRSTASRRARRASTRAIRARRRCCT